MFTRRAKSESAKIAKRRLIGVIVQDRFACESTRFLVGSGEPFGPRTVNMHMRRVDYRSAKRGA